MIRSAESLKLVVLAEFGKVNFLRAGNFLPQAIFNFVSGKFPAEEAEAFWQSLHELLADRAIERVEMPAAGYRLTRLGYELLMRNGELSAS